MEWIKMYEDVIEPMYETRGSAGMDIRVYCEDAKKEYILFPGRHVAIPTGLKVKLNPGYELQIRSRSGLAFKNGIIVLNSPGTIDPDYEGEIKICLINHGPWAYTVRSGDRIAQAVLAEFCQNPRLVKDKERGEGGLGSTG